MLLLAALATSAQSAQSCSSSPHAQHLGRCRCKCTLIDVGLNDGQSLTTWLPTAISNYAKLTPAQRASVTRTAGWPPRWAVPMDDRRRRVLEQCVDDLSGTCYYGFEGNRKFDAVIRKHAIRLERGGVRNVKLFTSTVFALEDGVQTFFLDQDSDATGSSLSGSKSLSRRVRGKSRAWKFHTDRNISDSYEAVNVPAVGARKFLRGVLDFSDVVALKVDVEGFEYRLLQSLLITEPRALCDLTLIAIEWHEMFMIDKSDAPGGPPLPANATRMLEWLLAAPECGALVLNLWRSPEYKQMEALGMLGSMPGMRAG